MQLVRESKWTFVTSNGSSVSAGFFAAEGGSITLGSPTNGQEVKFGYGGVGAGAGVGFKMQKLGRVALPGISASSESLPSYGSVFMTPQFAGRELSASDITGGCCVVELAGGIAWGHAAYALAFGIKQAELLTAAANPVAGTALLFKALYSANGYLLFRGWNFGIQAGVGDSLR